MSNSVKCLEGFFTGLVQPEFLRNILVEAEEYTSNLVVVRFNAICERQLVRGVSVAIVYTPGWVSELVVSILLSSDVDAREFITRIYQALISKQCYIEAAREYVLVKKRLSCRQAERKKFSELLEEILSEFGEKCVIQYLGDYELTWRQDVEDI